mmetsp:Transcript_136888/g.273034  ORF Transcript_136888/g.273034 Transcript_136888/m.273034 type:complete len:203 (-) Transcript_136888:369-977(-)
MLACTNGSGCSSQLVASIEMTIQAFSCLLPPVMAVNARFIMLVLILLSCAMEADSTLRVPPLALCDRDGGKAGIRTADLSAQMSSSYSSLIMLGNAFCAAGQPSFTRELVVARIRNGNFVWRSHKTSERSSARAARSKACAAIQARSCSTSDWPSACEIFFSAKIRAAEVSFDAATNSCTLSRRIAASRSAAAARASAAIIR